MGDYNKSTTQGFRGTRSSVSAAGTDAFMAPYTLPTQHTVTWVDGLTGSKNPHWRRQVALGQNASTQMSAQSVTVEYTPGHLEAQGYSGTYGVPANRRRNGFKGLIDCSTTLPSTGGLSSSPADSAAAGDYYQHLSRAFSGFQGQIFAGESRQALRMMKVRSQAIIGSVVPHLRSVKKRSRRDRTNRDRLKTVSNWWLEVQFGWMPLFRDIEDASKVIAEPRTMRRYVKGEGFGPTTIEFASDSQVLLGALEYRHRIRTSAWSHVKFYSVVQVRNNPVPSMREDFGFTARNFVPTLWELMPWSFLIDYFTNVGEVIQSASLYFGEGTTATRTGRVFRETFESSYSAAGNGLSTTTLLISSPAILKKTATGVARTPGVTVAIPTFRFQIPGFRQGLNIAALLLARKFKVFR